MYQTVLGSSKLCKNDKIMLQRADQDLKQSVKSNPVEPVMGITGDHYVKMIPISMCLIHLNYRFRSVQQCFSEQSQDKLKKKKSTCACSLLNLYYATESLNVSVP